MDMTKSLLLTLAAAMIGCSSSSSTGTRAALVGGIWAGSLVRALPSGQTDPCGTGTLQATIQQRGSSLTGTWTTSGWTNSGLCPSLDASGSVRGIVSGSTVSLTLTSTAESPSGYSLLGHIPGGTAFLMLTGTFSESLDNDGYTGGTFSITAQ
jgi:hypothetical protein